MCLNAVRLSAWQVINEDVWCYVNRNFMSPKAFVVALIDAINESELLTDGKLMEDDIMTEQED